MNAKDYYELVRILRTDVDPELKISLINKMLADIEADDTLSLSAVFIMNERLKRYRRTIYHELKPDK